MPRFETTPEVKYEKVAEHFRDLIASKSLKPGDSLPSYAVLRRDLGVSQVTYERAQRLLERDGLVSRQPGRGSFVAHTQLAKGVGSIAVAGLGEVGRNASGYWGELFEGIRDAARSERKSITLLDHPEAHTDWSGISGLIVGAFKEVHAPVPCVSLMCKTPHCTAVTADEYAGMLAAVAHLTEMGHRRIAYLHVTWSPESADRTSAYRNGLMDAGVLPDPRWNRQLTISANGGFYNHGLDSFRQWLAEDWKDLECTALLTQNDDSALGAIDALREAGYSVPEDVSVVGFDGILDAGRSQVDLTTVAMPLFELGRTAVRQLRLASDGNAGQISVKLDAPLRVGRTTAAPK